MKKVFIALVSILAPFTSYAGCSGNVCEDVTIDQVYLKSTGDYLIQTSGVEASLSTTCSAYGTIYLRLPETDSKKDILSLLLTANVAGKKTTVYVKNNASSCEISAVQINRE